MAASVAAKFGGKHSKTPPSTDAAGSSGDGASGVSHGSGVVEGPGEGGDGEEGGGEGKEGVLRRVLKKAERAQQREIERLKEQARELQRCGAMETVVQRADQRSCRDCSNRRLSVVSILVRRCF